MLIALLPVMAFPQTLAQGERDRALSDLYATRKQFLDAVAGLTRAQWDFKPDAKTWSIAECAEHIALSEDYIFDLVVKKVMSGPARPEQRAAVKGKDAVVLKQIPDRTTRYQAPKELQPLHRRSTAAVVAHFRESRNRTLDYVRSTSDALRVHFAPHPVMGLLDGYQWILLLSAHTARHVAQIEELKARPGFPAR